MVPGILPQLVTSGNEPWGTGLAGRFETHAANLLKRSSFMTTLVGHVCPMPRVPVTVKIRGLYG